MSRATRLRPRVSRMRRSADETVAYVARSEGNFYPQTWWPLTVRVAAVVQHLRFSDLQETVEPHSTHLWHLRGFQRGKSFLVL